MTHIIKILLLVQLARSLSLNAQNVHRRNCTRMAYDT